MNINNTINFIKRGMNYENGLLRKGCFALGFFSLLAIVPGIVLGDEILTISIIMQFVSLMNTIIIFVLTTNPRTIKKRLWINLIFPICTIINLLLFSVIIYINLFGINIGIVALFLPTILTATLVYFRTIQLLKKDVFICKKVSSNNIALSFTFTGVCSASSGLFGMKLGETLFKDASQMTITFVILSIMVLGTCLLSISVNNILKLHYMYKLKKLDITVNQVIIPGIIYLQKNDIAALNK